MGTESESKSGGGQRPSGGGSRSDDRSRADKSKASSSGRETNSGSARGKPSSRDDRGGQRSDSSRKPSSGGSRDDRDKDRSRSEQDRRSTSDRDRKSQSERDRKSQPGGSSRSQSDRRRSPSDRDRRPQSEQDSGRSGEGSRASESHRDGRRDIQPHRGRPEDQQNIRPCRVFDSRPSPPRREGPGSDRRGDSRDGRPSSRERRWVMTMPPTTWARNSVAPRPHFIIKTIFPCIWTPIIKIKNSENVFILLSHLFVFYLPIPSLLWDADFCLHDNCRQATFHISFIFGRIDSPDLWISWSDLGWSCVWIHKVKCLFYYCSGKMVWFPANESKHWLSIGSQT